ncbi:lactate permease [Candidatus Saccharibacteria bacterium]|nr:MAG: lactate permease [Candidatus Saccharibacteria bacterium]
MLLAAALSAIVLPLVLLVVFRMPAKYGMSISALVVAGFAYGIWQMPDIVLAASALQGMHRAATIVWILLGAILLLKVLEASGAMHRIKSGFETISPDMRVQAVLVGVVFVALLEGLTGFGAPVTIAAPLLVALGFRPIAAIVIGLIGDSVPVVFGAVGTPVVIGLSNVPGSDDPAMLQSVARTVTMLDFAVAMLLPLIAVTVLVKMFGEHKQERSIREIRQVAPWALMVGLAYALSALTASYVVSPELISIIAGLITLVVAITSAHRNWLLDRTIAWRTHHEEVTVRGEAIRPMSLAMAWLPYGLVIVGLIMTRLVPAAQSAVLAAGDASWRAILGIESIASQWSILYSPGTVMLLAAIIAALVYRLSIATVREVLVGTGGVVVAVSAALIPTLIMLQMFANSAHNTANLVAMPAFIAEQLAAVFAGAWVLVAPVVGALGAFIAGSSTVSALTMAGIQYAVALSSGMPTDLVLAQQLSGSAAGNMIAIHNIIGASAVVGIYHQEGNIIRRLLPVVGVYIAIGVVAACLLLSVGLV